MLEPRRPSAILCCRSRSWGLPRKEPLQEGEHAKNKPARCPGPLEGRTATSSERERARTEARACLRAPSGKSGHQAMDLSLNPLQGRLIYGRGGATGRSGLGNPGRKTAAIGAGGILPGERGSWRGCFPMSASQSSLSGQARNTKQTIGEADFTSSSFQGPIFSGEAVPGHGG